MAVSGQLERGWRRSALIRDLAAGDQTQVQLAVKYGVTQPAVSAFRDRHEREIDAVRTQLDDKWAALWVADKFNRVAELQSDVETITGEDDEKLLRVKHAALRQIAEELGQLKQVVEVGGSVTYTITGLDPAALT